MTREQAEFLARAVEGGAFDDVIGYGWPEGTYDRLMTRCDEIAGERFSRAHPYWTESMDPFRVAVVRREAIIHPRVLRGGARKAPK